ncbi:hypothetical protein QZH41_001152 [Actinostola sp. cb2023]|nr:hypothetical protein QZH41_001152 [Actinostola sp. cb2023]
MVVVVMVVMVVVVVVVVMVVVVMLVVVMLVVVMVVVVMFEKNLCPNSALFRLSMRRVEHKKTKRNFCSQVTNSVEYEADIALTERDVSFVHETKRKKRNAVRQRKKLWPKRIIPYEISSRMEAYVDNILEAMREFHKHTCIRFVQKTNERNWIKFTQDKGGQWGRWGEWGSCDKDCGYGTQQRKRVCDEPKPRYGGNKCSGADTQKRMCNMLACPTGYYIYLETSWPARHGYTSTLSSDWLDPSEARCLTYWYNMHGHSVGSLRVYITDDLEVKKLLWLRSGQQGNTWRKASIEIASSSKYKN